MREVRKLSKIKRKGLNYVRISFFTIILILGSALIIAVLGGNESNYSGVTKVCISCHNDSDFQTIPMAIKYLHHSNVRIMIALCVNLAILIIHIKLPLYKQMVLMEQG